MKKVIVTIEKDQSDSSYWARIESENGLIVAYGSSRAQLKEEIKNAWESHLEIHEYERIEYSKGYKFYYNYDLSNIFELFNELNISKLAELSNINPSLLRQYSKGIAKASDKRKKVIEKAIHQLGRELIEVKL
jgi:predicted RNase H-like HicB family nuclease